MASAARSKRALDDSAAPAQAAPLKKQNSAKAAELKEFRDVFARLRDEICAELPKKYEMPADAVEYVRRMLDYNVPGGKLNRGLTVVHSLELIVGGELTAAQKLQASALGWCIEWLQACFLVADDVMDKSITRRGQPCWYKLPEIGFKACNDAFILRSCVQFILKKYFEDNSKLYMELSELFRETILQTELGQMLDLNSEAEDKHPVDFTGYTPERHTKIVKYKTAFYSFYLPIACAMMIGGLDSDAALGEAREILIEMGVYFQVQDDYLDCYGDESVIGKKGTDIEDMKCSWLVVHALKKATPAQRAVLENNYGKNDATAVARIKALYKELKLEADFHAYEAQSYEKLVTAIKQAKHTPHAVFDALLKKIYKRSK